MADTEKAIRPRDRGAEPDGRSGENSDQSFYATSDWRRLERIQALRTGRCVVTKSTTVFRQGHTASAFYTLIDGWGLRYKQLNDGRRQILSFLLPGDPITLDALSPRPLAYSVQLLAEAVVNEFDIEVMNKLVRESDELRAGVNACYERELAMADEHLTNLGRRSAKERIAHSMLEFDARLECRGAVQDGHVFLPLRQRHLADALGLTTIHVNRTLRSLRDEELVDVRGGVLRILDRERLAALAGFDASYLCLGALAG